MVKAEGGENDLLQRIAADPAFGVTLEELEQLIVPEEYVGRAPEQTADFLAEEVQPVLDRYANLKGITAEINV